MPKGKVIGDDQGKVKSLAEYADPFGGVRHNPFTTDRPTKPKPNVTDPRNPPPKRPNERRN